METFILELLRKDNLFTKNAMLLNKLEPNSDKLFGI